MVSVRANLPLFANLELNLVQGSGQRSNLRRTSGSVQPVRGSNAVRELNFDTPTGVISVDRQSITIFTKRRQDFIGYYRSEWRLVWNCWSPSNIPRHLSCLVEVLNPCRSPHQQSFKSAWIRLNVIEYLVQANPSPSRPACTSPTQGRSSLAQFFSSTLMVQAITIHLNQSSCPSWSPPQAQQNSKQHNYSITKLSQSPQ
jgi:hypothetical protein